MLRRIAQATGLSLKRVIRYAGSGRCPDWNPGRRAATSLDPLSGLTDAWVEPRGRNAAEAVPGVGPAGFQRLQRRGATLPGPPARQHRRLGSRAGPLHPPALPFPSARKLSFEFIRRPEDRKAQEQARLVRLRGCEAGLRDGHDLAGEFAEIVRKRSKVPPGEWLAKAEASEIAELRGFAGAFVRTRWP